jgi:hypothetical protein
MLEALSLTSEVLSKRLRDENLRRARLLDPNGDLTKDELEANGEVFSKQAASFPIANQSSVNGAESRVASGGVR